MVTLAMNERGAGAHDEQLAQIAIAHLADAPQALLAAARTLARRQAEEGGKLPAVGEGSRFLDGGDDRRCGDWTNAGDRHQPARLIVGLDERLDLIVDDRHLRVDGVDLAQERRQGLAHAIGNDNLAVLIDPFAKKTLERVGVLNALRRHNADLRQIAA
jgi:hypothetical protein